MAEFTYNSKTRTLSVVLTDAEVLVFEDQFIGGPLEGIESALTQNIRQRTKGLASVIVDSAIKNGSSLSFVDINDLIRQHTSKPEYKNAATRYEEEQERIAAEQAAAAVE